MTGHEPPIGYGHEMLSSAAVPPRLAQPPPSPPPASGARSGHEPIEPTALEAIRALVVRPGDTLVVQITEDLMSDDQLVQAREHIQACLPAGAQVIVVQGPGQLAVVRLED